MEDEPKGAAAEENKDEWNMFLNQARSSGGGSTPPTEKKQGDITDPRKYETGYMSIDHQIAPDAALYEYYTMGGLSNKAGSCTPTAAVNLLKYYTLRKRLRRSLFILKSDGKDDAIATFNRLAQCFGTVLSDVEREGVGTMFSNVKPGLDNYFRSIGVTDAVTHYYGFDAEERNGEDDVADWAEMKRRLDIGDPFIYSVNEHYYYNNHAVLAVGYLQYKYQRQQATGQYASRYLLVVDGHNVHANRYINVDVGHMSECDEMVTLYFVYTNRHK